MTSPPINPNSTHAQSIKGLKAARAELLARVKELEKEKQRLMIQADAMEISMRALEPTTVIEGEKPLLVFRETAKPEHGATRGAVLATLRVAEEPLSPAEIAERLMLRRGLDAGDKVLRGEVRRRVGLCLRKLKPEKVVRRVGDDRYPNGRSCRWVR